MASSSILPGSVCSRDVTRFVAPLVTTCFALGFVASMAGADGCINYGSPPPIPWIGQANTPEIAEDVATTDGYSYITGNGLHVIDISDPSNPETVGQVFTNSYPRALAVTWPYVYLAGADFEETFDVVDVSVPSSPNLVGTLSGTGYYPTCAAVYGSHVLVGIFSILGNRISVFNVANPASPALAGGIDMGYPADIAVSGAYAYVPNGGVGLTVLDLSNPAVLNVVVNVATVGFAQGVGVADHFVYVCASGTMDLQIFDISDPTIPTFLGGIEIPNGATDVAVAGGYAYVVGGNSTLSAVDVTVPSAPVLLGSVGTQSQPTAVVPAGTNIVVADSFGGLLVYPPQCASPVGIPSETGMPARIVLHPSSPNPFSDHTVIRFDLANRAPASIRIYDTAGRLVRTLASEIRERGENRVLWNGRNDRGERLAGGVYFYRLEVAGGTETRPLVLID